MVFEIKGGNKKQKNAIKEAAAFCFPILFTKRMMYSLDVNVHIHDIGDAYGYCSWQDDNVKPREFLIQLHRAMGIEDLINSFFHESVHMKQYAYNEFKERYKHGHQLFWYDKDCTKLPYQEQPWEIEALEKEKHLYDGFINR